MPEQLIGGWAGYSQHDDVCSLEEWVPIRRAGFLGGVQRVLPLAAGVLAFMTTWGVVALHVGIPAVVAQFMTLLIFAGSQLVVVQLWQPEVILVASFMLNLRHTLYSVSLAPALKSLPLR